MEVKGAVRTLADIRKIKEEGFLYSSVAEKSLNITQQIRQSSFMGKGKQNNGSMEDQPNCATCPRPKKQIVTSKYEELKTNREPLMLHKYRLK